MLNVHKSTIIPINIAHITNTNIAHAIQCNNTYIAAPIPAQIDSKNPILNLFFFNANKSEIH